MSLARRPRFRVATAFLLLLSIAGVAHFGPTFVRRLLATKKLEALTEGLLGAVKACQTKASGAGRAQILSEFVESCTKDIPSGPWVLEPQVLYSEGKFKLIDLRHEFFAAGPKLRVCLSEKFESYQGTRAISHPSETLTLNESYNLEVLRAAEERPTMKVFPNCVPETTSPREPDRQLSRHAWGSESHSFERCKRMVPKRGGVGQPVLSAVEETTLSTVSQPTVTSYQVSSLLPQLAEYSECLKGVLTEQGKELNAVRDAKAPTEVLMEHDGEIVFQEPPPLQDRTRNTFWIFRDAEGTFYKLEKFF